MKRLIVAITLIAGISGIANAQASTGQEKSQKLKKGVQIVDNKAMLCKNNKCIPLTKTYNCTDGCKVATDGTITKPDGTTMKLMNGYQIDKNGKVMMIPHGQKGHVCGKDCPMHGMM